MPKWNSSTEDVAIKRERYLLKLTDRMRLFIPFTYLVKLDTLVYSQLINLPKDGLKSYFIKEKCRLENEVEEDVGSR